MHAAQLIGRWPVAGAVAGSGFSRDSIPRPRCQAMSTVLHRAGLNLAPLELPNTEEADLVHLASKPCCSRREHSPGLHAMRGRWRRPCSPSPAAFSKRGGTTPCCAGSSSTIVSPQAVGSYVGALPVSDATWVMQSRIRELDLMANHVRGSPTACARLAHEAERKAERMHSRLLAMRSKLSTAPTGTAQSPMYMIREA